MTELLDELRGTPASGWADEIAAVMEDEIISPLAKHRRLRPLLLHLLKNLSDRLSSAQAAKIVSVERKYFSKFFLRETGFNFSWWNREIRIRLATRLLQQRGRNIDSVALAVGYIDLTTFGRAFKKCNGICPQAYRRSRGSLTRTYADSSIEHASRRHPRDEKRRVNDDKRRPSQGDAVDATAVDSVDPLDRQPIRRPLEQAE
jgi:AraC-like DNA-binding protein